MFPNLNIPFRKKFFEIITRPRREIMSLNLLKYVLKFFWRKRKDALLHRQTRLWIKVGAQKQFLIFLLFLKN